MHETTIQGLTTGETVFAFFAIFLMGIAVLFFWLHNRMIQGEIDIENVPVHFKPVETITFDYSIDNLIGLYYKGTYLIYASIINDTVFYHWVKDNSEAIPSHPKPQNHFMGIERNLRKLALQKMKQSIPREKTSDGVWDKPNYKTRLKAEKDLVTSRKNRNIDMEVKVN